MKNTILLLTFLAASTCMAATKIAYDEVPKHLGRFGAVLAYRGFTVTTSDGKTHSGRRLLPEHDHLRIFHRDNSFEDIPGIGVTRIEITQAGRFFHHVVDHGLLVALLAVGGAGELGIILTPPVLAYAGASAPILLAADAIAFLIPSKVYDIIQRDRIVP